MSGSRSADRADATWPAGIVAITPFVEDLAEAKRFYGDVFRLSEQADGQAWGIRTASFRDPGGHIWEIAS